MARPQTSFDHKFGRDLRPGRQRLPNPLFANREIHRHPGHKAGDLFVIDRRRTGGSVNGHDLPANVVAFLFAAGCFLSRLFTAYGEYSECEYNNK